MTTERTKIIELLADYMDKTLRFGCLIELEDGIEYFWCDEQESRVKNWTYYKSWYWNWDYGSWENDRKLKRIIWHYSMDAVLKYIEKESGYAAILDNWFFQPCDDDWVRVHHDWDYELFLDAIPNKPLQTYTNQEDKELLELLLSIK